MSATPPPVHCQRPSPVAPGRPGLVPPRDWDLWSQPRRVVAYVLTVDVAAVVLAVGSLFVVSFHRSDALLGVALLLATVAYIEATGPIERVRERSASVPHVDLNSIWMFSAALLLHPALVAVVVTVVYSWRWLRIRHHVVFRQTFSAAAAVLSAYAAMVVLAVGGDRFGLPRFADMPRNGAGSGIVLAAGITFVVVNMLLIAAAIAMTHPRPTLSNVLPGWEGESLELATVGLAVVVAWALADWPPVLLLLFWIAYLLHSRVLFPQLRHAATRDSKTGLLNLDTWRGAANEALATAATTQQPCTLLMIDLDTFKHVNDTYGHLTGDLVLRVVSTEIRSQVRPTDIVGRFGGEEIVVLLPGSTLGSANHIAERIRRCISDSAVITSTATPAPEPPAASASESAPAAAPGTPGRMAGEPPPAVFVRVTASIGIAAFPDHGHTLDNLIESADHAMLAAKNNGRNQVRVSSAASG